MRTFQEIVDFVKVASDDAVLTFTPEVLVPYLPFNLAMEAGLLLPEAKEEDWTQRPMDEASVVEEMRRYMADFGWDKAINHRGISAGRTVEKMTAWLWLLGKDELQAFAEDDANYPMYGAPILRKICEEMEFPIPNDERAARMSQGLPCGDPECTGCRTENLSSDSNDGIAVVAVGGSTKL